jgi:gas vesicle protein
VGLKTNLIMRTGKVELGTMAGLSINAIASILFPSEKGSTTRKQIMNKGRDYVDKLKTKFDGSFDSLTDKFKSTKKDAEGLVKGKAKYNNTKKAVKIAAINFKHDGAAGIKHTTS